MERRPVNYEPSKVYFFREGPFLHTGRILVIRPEPVKENLRPKSQAEIEHHRALVQTLLSATFRYLSAAPIHYDSV